MNTIMIKLWTVCEEDEALMEVRRLEHSRSSNRRFSSARYLPWAERKPMCTLATTCTIAPHGYINSCGQFIHSSGTTPAIVPDYTTLVV